MPSARPGALEGVTVAEPSPVEPAGIPQLVIIRGAKKGRVLPLDGDSLLLTRRQGPGALHDPEVSSRHAEVIKTPAGFLVRDLKSTNGTYVNGRSVQEAILAPGDEVVVGRTVLRWEAAQAEIAPPAPRPAEARRGGDAMAGAWSPTREFDPRPGSPRAGATTLTGPWAQLAGVEATPLIMEEDRAPLSDVRGFELLELAATGMDLKVPHGTSVILEVIEGPEKGRVVTFTKGEMNIGRYGTDIVIKDSDISRLHAIVYVFGQDQIFIRDMQSTNGTFVNGVRVRFARVQSGDTLVLGRSLIHLVVRWAV